MKLPSPIGRAAIRTTWGEITLWSSARGLCRCCLPRQSRLPVRPLKVLGWSIQAEGVVRQHLTCGVNYILHLVESGSVRELPPLDLSSGTAFQRLVWHALQRIERGTTKTYGQVACLIRRRKTARAVGAACRANPLPVFIPCHRVVPRGGGVGGYSSGMGWKQWLLQQEGHDWAAGLQIRRMCRSRTVR